MPINYTIADSIYLGRTDANKIYEGSVKKWEKKTDYFCVTAKADGAQITMVNNGGNAPVLYYSIDGQQTWTLWNYSAITLTNTNDKCYFYGNNPNGISSSTSVYSNFAFSDNVTVSGNIQTLLTQAGNMTSVPAYGFIFLFTNCSKLIDASGLKLPATTLNQYCYGRLFDSCSNLKYGVEELPATTLPRFAYGYMYCNCTQLIKASHVPENAVITGTQVFDHAYQGCNNLRIVQEVLPPIKGSNQYDGCFYNCGQLVKAPKITITGSYSYCCREMFRGCTALSFIEIEVTGSSVSSNSFNNWLTGAAGHGTIMAPSTLNLTTDSTSGLPTNWNRVTSADITPDYLCFETLEANNEIIIENYGSNYNITKPTIYYSFDKSAWTRWDLVTPIQLANIGDKVYFYGSNNVICMNEFSGYSRFNSTKPFNASGNVTTLLSKYDLVNTLSSFCFARLFENCYNLKTAPYFSNDITYAKASSMREMYENTGIVTAPEIPIVKGFEPWTCGLMFASCRDLETPPSVVGGVDHAQSAAFYGMFSNCEKLKETPLLITPKLYDRAYYEMFLNCKKIESVNLNYIQEVNANNVSAEKSLYRAFKGCTNLKEVRIALNDLKTNNFYEWLDGCAVDGEFYNTGSATYPSGVSGIPTNWQVFTDDGYYFVKNISDTNGYIVIYRNGTPAMNELEYSFDRTNWTAIASTGNIHIDIPAKTKLFLRGDNPNGLAADVNNKVTINPYDMQAAVGGDIRSLINKTNYTSETVMPAYAFPALHSNSVNLYDARDLVIKYSAVSKGGLRAFFNYSLGVNCRYAPDVRSITSIGVDGMRFFCAYTNVTYCDLRNVTSFTTASFSNTFVGSKMHAVVMPNATGFGTNSLNWLGNNPDKGIVFKTSSQNPGRGVTSGVPLTWCTVDYA